MTPAANPGSKSSSVAEDPAEDGYNKRATLIFLAAVGGTLLLTGATGTLLLRRANASANIVLASAKVANDSAPLRLTDHARGLRYKSKTRTLKDLFKISIVEPEKASIDFRTNRHISDSVNSVARPLNLVDTKETGDVSPEDVSSAVVDGVKALAIATTIVVGTAGTTVFVLAKRMGVSDPQSFADGLRDLYFRPFARSVALYLPFAIPNKLKQPEISIEEKAQMAIETREWDKWAAETDVKDLVQSGKDP